MNNFDPLNVHRLTQLREQLQAHRDGCDTRKGSGSERPHRQVHDCATRDCLYITARERDLTKLDVRHAKQWFFIHVLLGIVFSTQEWFIGMPLYALPLWIVLGGFQFRRWHRADQRLAALDPPIARLLK